MFSGLCCDCHRFFSGEVDGVYLKSHKLFKSGKSRDGWYSNNDLVAALKEITPLIKSMHPNMDVVITFDNSTSRHKRAPNALDVTDLPLKDGGKRARVMRDTIFMVE